MLAGIFYSRAQGIDKPGKYQGDFSVADCFIKSRFKEGIKNDSISTTHVMRGQQVWRTIGLENAQNRELLNTNSACAEIGLFEIIKFGLFEKKLNAFWSDDFKPALQNRLRPDELLTCIFLSDSSMVTVFDANGNAHEELSKTTRYLNGSDVKSYLLKEDWILNSYSGKMEKYIVGIAPVVYDQKAQKAMPLFWLYYPEWKSLFAAFEARNFYSHGVISFDDVFMRKYFVSQISKESNIFNRGVKLVNHGRDAGMESEVIKEKLMNMESDLFPY